MAFTLDLEKLKARLGDLNSSSGGANMGFINLKDGRNVVRVLPPKEGTEFVQEVFMHYGVGKSSTNKKGTTVVCPTTHGDHKPCPICEASKQLKNLSKAKDDAYDKQSSQLYRKRRIYFNAIDRAFDLNSVTKNEEGKYIGSDGKENNPVQILAVGVTIYKAILTLLCDPDYGDLLDPDAGLDLIITKTGTGRDTDYDTKAARKESPIGLDDWQDQLHDLTTLAKVKTWEELNAILMGEDAPPVTGNTSDNSGEGNTSNQAGGSSDDEGGTGESAEAIDAKIKEALARRQNR